MKTATPGSVSHGTHRPEDLIPTFARELQRLRGSLPRALFLAVRDCELRFDSQCGLDDGFTSETVEALSDALQEFAPPGFYFGTHPGDGSDFGFWLDESFIDEFDGLRVSDTSEVPKGYRGEVLHVNDHGNCTLYVSNSRGLREVWGVV